MGFESVSLYNFRNLANETYPVSGERIFLVGENGQGKTNFLEALYCLCYGASFRERKDRDLITHGCDEMGVTANTGYMGLSNTVNLKITDKKKISVNGKAIKDRKEMISLNPCVLFSHDDIWLVRGTPEKKRWFLNQTLSLLDPVFVEDLRSYTKIMRMRNAALKDKNFSLLDILDEQVIAAGLLIQLKRESLLLDFNDVFTQIFQQVIGACLPVRLNYSASWKNNNIDDIRKTLVKSRERDIAIGATTKGPHRDKIDFILNDLDFTREASTGQCRIISLALRIAQAKFFTQRTSRLPVLLLDDVLLELDISKRTRLIELLPENEQAFFTFLPKENYHLYRDNCRVYTLENGRLISSEKS